MLHQSRKLQHCDVKVENAILRSKMSSMKKMQQHGKICQQGRKYNNMVENVIKVENTTTWSKM